MSRTDKDRPYWVKVADEGVETHYHDFGSYRRRGGYYREDKVFTKNGEPVMEDRIIKMTAKRVIETVPRLKSVPYTKEIAVPFRTREGMYTTIWNGMSAYVANPIYSEAEHLIALGLPHAEITIRVDRVQKIERIWVPRVTECDYDPDSKTKDVYWKSNCGKELPYWKGGGYHCRCSWCRPGDEPRQRTRKRVFLSAMKKAANSGEDEWEDGFNELDLSQPDMFHRGWC